MYVCLCILYPVNIIKPLKLTQVFYFCFIYISFYLAALVVALPKTYLVSMCFCMVISKRDYLLLYFFSCNNIVKSCCAIQTSSPDYAVCASVNSMELQNLI